MSISRWPKAGALSLLFLFSCGKSLPTFDNVDLQAWQDDKSGCSGQRTSMMGALKDQSEKLLALSQQDVIRLLGKPDENELYKRNQKFFYYFVQPSKACSDTVTLEPKKLVIRFNAVGLAKEVEIQ
jgi:hypothetical protein